MDNVKKRGNTFTLVEVLLAMAICVFGLCSVMVLFPVGVTAARDASQVGQAGDVAEQVLNFVNYCIKNDPSGEAFETFTGWTLNDTSTYVHRDESSTPPLTFKSPEAETALRDNLTNIFQTTNIQVTLNHVDRYEIRVKNKPIEVTDAAGNFDEATYEVRLWSNFLLLDPTQVSSGTNWNAKLLGAVRMIVEVSWPLEEEDYTKRQKVRRSLEIYKEL